MGYFQLRYDSRVVIYEHKMFIRLATEEDHVKTRFVNYDYRLFIRLAAGRRSRPEVGFESCNFNFYF